MSYVIPSLILLVGLVVLLKWAKAAGEDCVFCGGKALRLSNLPEEERDKVLAYFDRVEDRVPEFESVMVCLTCKKVKDGWFQGPTTIGMAAKCKVCKLGVVLNEDLSCPECDASYEWMTFPFSGDYQFLLPKVTDGE